MEWALLAELVLNGIEKIPSPMISGAAGAIIGSLLTKYFTQKREDEKILREKAEALTLLLHQTRQRLTEWELAIQRQSEVAHPAPVERPVTVLLDLNQAWALLDLYFPALRSQFTELDDASTPYIYWLEVQWDHQDRDFESWHAQYRQEEGAALSNAYRAVCDEMIAAIGRAVPGSRRFARLLARRRSFLSRF